MKGNSAHFAWATNDNKAVEIANSNDPHYHQIFETADELREFVESVVAVGHTVFAESVTPHAVQWFVHGDHAEVGKFNIEFFMALDTCGLCGDTMAQHGKLNDSRVCPHDWIVKDGHGYFAIKPEIYETHYS